MSSDFSNPDLARPHVYLKTLPVRERISRTQPLGLPIINLGFNELPYPPTPKVAEAIAGTALRANYYGSPKCDLLRSAIGKLNNLNPDQIICGNGSEELLDVIARNFVERDDEILISQYGYVQFVLTANRMNARLVKAPETEFTTNVENLLEAVTEKTKLVFIANPNNPTGTVLGSDEIRRLIAGLPIDAVLVLDLAYGEFFCEDYCAEMHALVDENENVVVTRTFSKAFGLAGLRVGWCHAPEWMMAGFYAARGMGTVNAMAQAAALASLGEINTIRMRVEQIVGERERSVTALSKIGIETIPSRSNFLMATITGMGSPETEQLVEYLFDKAGIVVNRTREEGLEHFFRFCLSTREHNDRLISTTASFLEEISQ